jgi:ADP-heptose:LPS heptosyltransferase
LSLKNLINNGIKKLFYRILSSVLYNRHVNLPIDPQKIKKILVCRYDVIGDMIVTIPMIDLISQKAPWIKIHVLASPKNAPILSYDKRVEKTYIYQSKIFKFIKLIKDLRKEDYDVILSIVFNRTTKAGILCNVISQSKAIKLTIEYPGRTDLYSILFNAQIPIAQLRGNITMAELLCDFAAKSFGLDYSDIILNPQIFYSDISKQKANLFIGQNLDNQKFMIYNISTGSFEKSLSRNKNLEILLALSEKIDIKIVIICSPKDREVANEIINNYPKLFEYYSTIADILDLCPLIEKCEAILTPDTSISHFAAAFRKPVLILFNHSSYNGVEWMPYNVKFKSLIADAGKSSDSIDTNKIVEEFMELLK